MALLGLLIGIAVIFLGSALGCIFGFCQSDSCDKGGWIAGIIVCLLVGIMPLIITLACQYQDNLTLEERIPALTITIQEQRELLAEEPTLGSGLEGLEIKREIQNNIKERNELIAMGKVRIRSAWWYYKPIPVWEEK